MKSRQFKQDVLLLGEAGVGKRYLAREIHSNRGNKAEPLLIDGLSTNDREVQHILSKVGNNSTLCVANLDSLGPHNQVALLFFIKERKQHRNLTIILTATSVDTLDSNLAKMLNEFEKVVLPPLRERLNEIPDLAKSIVQGLCKTLGRKELRVEVDGHRVLMRNSWPENVRGLYNVLAKGVMISTGDTLVLPKDMLNEDQHLREAIENIDAGRDFILDDSLWAIEELLIERAMSIFHNNQSRVATLIGISEANFRYRLKKFGIKSVREKGMP